MLIQVLILTIMITTSITDAHGPALEHDVPQPYKFGYSVKDHHGEQHRAESGDGHSGVKGSYGFSDHRGVHRQVDYVADHGGFRAQVKTNEHGTAKQDPAEVHMISSAHPYFGASHGHVHGGYGGHHYI